MYFLFEMPDVFLIVLGLVFLLIIGVLFIVFKSHNKVKPISEDDRYDHDEIEIKKISSDELTAEQKQAKDELEKVFNQMSEDLDKQKVSEEVIDSFEKEQEENAIISYQELLEHAEKLKNQPVKYEKAQLEKPRKVEFEKPRTIEFEKPRKTEAVRSEKVEVIDSKPVKTKKSFKSSDIVSPIYGVQSNKNMVRQKKDTNRKKSDIISKAYEQESFEKEETQNLDFLNSLKEFRKNL